MNYSNSSKKLKLLEMIVEQIRNENAVYKTKIHALQEQKSELIEILSSKMDELKTSKSTRSTMMDTHKYTQVYGKRIIH
jgi:hypothetical protein